MNGPTRLQVLWRFRWLVSAGFVIAVAVAFLSLVRVSPAGGSVKLAYRQHEDWASYARLFVTRTGFEWGSSGIGHVRKGESISDRAGAQQIEEGRLSSIAVIYSNLVGSDQIRQIMLREGPIQGQVVAAAIPVTEGSDLMLPIISVEATADTPAASRSLATRATDALVEYVHSQQDANHIPPDDRIVLTLINRSGETRLLAGRSKTMPVVVFGAIMAVFCGIAFLLERLRPRPRIAEPSSAPVADASRRTAVR
jgi:hypothetical protein